MARERSCWYYDNQMLDRMTCVSLHANTYPTHKEGKEKQIWRKWSDKAKGGEVDAGGYSMTPLCTSILSEDFQVSISNTWSGGGSADILGDVWNGVRAAAPYTKVANQLIQDAGKKAGEYASDPTKDTGLAKTLAKGLAKAGEFAEKHGDDMVDYLNSRLISQGTRFTYYAGTGLSFGNLQMRFTMFPIWTSEETPTFLTVPQQLETLFPYVIGQYDNLYLGEEKKDDGSIVDMASEMIGWQKPPAGYQADWKDIDRAGMKGTLKLRIGSFYVLESLVCQSLSFNLSRQMVKKPEAASWTRLDKIQTDDKEKGIKLGDQMLFSPLFADVVMVFEPATKYSDRSMRQFIYGLNIAGDANEGGREASNLMSKNLKDEISTLKAIYGE